MPIPLFYLFAILMIIGGVCVVCMKSPVSSAVGMIGSFISIAALFIGLNAFFIGTLQILVYAGAIMVLFIFIIMLLDLKKEDRSEFSYSSIATAVAVPLLFVFIMLPVLISVDKDFKKLDGYALVAAEKLQSTEQIAEDSIIRKSLRGEKDLSKPANPQAASLPDVNLIGQKLYTEYNFPLQVIGVLLLVSTIGCVALSKKLHGEDTPTGSTRLAKTTPKSTDIPEVQLPKNSDQTKAKTVTSVAFPKKEKPANLAEEPVEETS